MNDVIALDALLSAKTSEDLAVASGAYGHGDQFENLLGHDSGDEKDWKVHFASASGDMDQSCLRPKHDENSGLSQNNIQRHSFGTEHEPFQIRRPPETIAPIAQHNPSTQDHDSEDVDWQTLCNHELNEPPPSPYTVNFCHEGSQSQMLADDGNPYQLEPSQDASAHELDALIYEAEAFIQELRQDVPGNDEPGNDEPGTDEPGNDVPGNDDPCTSHSNMSHKSHPSPTTKTKLYGATVAVMHIPQGIKKFIL